MSNKIIIGSVVIGILIISFLTGNVIAQEKEKCEKEITLSVKDSFSNYNLCLTKEEYTTTKTSLKNIQIENVKKGYDFDVKEYPLALAVFDKELRERGGLTIEGKVTKEKIKIELLKLLN